MTLENIPKIGYIPKLKINNKPTKTELIPVLAPTEIPVVDSTNEVTVEVPKIDPPTVPIASTKSAL